MGDAADVLNRINDLNGTRNVVAHSAFHWETNEADAEELGVVFHYPQLKKNKQAKILDEEPIIIPRKVFQDIYTQISETKSGLDQLIGIVRPVIIGAAGQRLEITQEARGG